MRLTLRTLLAYLDDILEPSQARLIGLKIAESPMAQELVARIREVTRRRRLLAPDVDGPGMGVDPNLISEYLDNALPPDDVSDIEQVCLDSDVNLAEVAASHQILTLVLGEPVSIVPRSRERMYALGPITARVGALESPEPSRTDAKDVSPSPASSRAASAASGMAAAVGTAAVGAIAPRPAEAAVDSTGTTVPVESRVPEYLRSEPKWRRVVPWVVVALLAVVFGSLLATDPAFRRMWRSDAGSSAGNAPSTDGSASAPGDAVAANARDAGASAATTADGSKDPAGAKAASGESPAVPAGRPVVASNVPDGAKAGTIDRPPPPEPGDAKKPAPAKSGNLDADVAAPPPDGKDGGKPGDVAGNEKPAVARPPEVAAVGPRIEYQSADGILLGYSPELMDFTPLPRRSLLRTGDALASPEPFDSVLSVDRGRLTLTLAGGSIVDLLEANSADVVAIGTRQARLLLQTPASRAEPAVPKADADAKDKVAAGDEKAAEGGAAPARPAPVAVILSIGNDRWMLTLGDSTLCAIEVSPREPDVIGQEGAVVGWTGRIAVVSGQARVSHGADQMWTLQARTLLSLQSNDVADGSAQFIVDADMPRWIDPGAGRSITRRHSSLFEKEFQPGQGVGQFLPAVVGSATAQISELSAKTLALTGHAPALVRALASSPHKETRVAAIVGLRQWLSRAPQNGEALIADLERSFPSGDDRIALQLLRGFGPDDARDLVKSSQLVDWLDHPQLGVRELAYFHLRRLSGLNYNYDAQMPEAQRTAAANRFRAHLRKEGGALLKTPK